MCIDSKIMVEKYRKQFCLTSRIFNTFISLLLVVSLLILVANMSHNDTKQRLYRFSVCGNKILTDAVNIPESRDSRLECTPTNSNTRATISDNIRSKDSDNIRSKDITENLEFDHAPVEFAGDYTTQSTGLVTTTDGMDPDDQEEKEFFLAGFDMSVPPAEMYPKQAVVEASMVEAEIEDKDSAETENEFKQFEKYVNESFERETEKQSEGKLDIVHKQKKRKHFAFLKVHKAGSTTMQNIFFRFGLRNNLTFVLPIKGHYLIKAKHVIPVQSGEQYDILSNHIRNFKGHFFKRFLPKDSVNVAIVREPLDRMISAAFYYREVWNKKYLLSIPKERFIQNLIRKTDKYEPVSLSRTKNSMGLDFGFPKTITANDQAEIKTRMGRLVKRFNLVLVMERFDESLILLKRFMDWDISDVMYLPTNSHKHSDANLRRRDLLKFRKTNFLDYIIYDTFNQILDAKVKAEGTDFEDEVKNFQSILQLAKTFCEKENKSGPPLNVPASKWDRAFTFAYSECEYINMKELDFVAKLKTRHMKMHNVSKRIADQVT